MNKLSAADARWFPERQRLVENIRPIAGQDLFGFRLVLENTL